MNDFNRHRVRRVALGSIVSFVGNLITIFGRVILVPLFLKYWGTERYGEWLTLYATVGYMSMLDLGIQTYVINKLNQCHSTERIDEYRSILRSALKVSLLICLVVIILIVLIVPFLSMERWFHFTYTDHSLTVLVTILLAIQIVAKVPSGIISGLYRTFGEFPRGAMIVNIQVALVFVITAVVIVSRGGFALLAVIQLVPISVGVVYVFRDISRRHPEVQLGFKGGSLKKGFSFLIPSSFFFLIRISMLTAFTGSTIIVATQLGPVAVAIFSTMRTLANITLQVPHAITRALWPELTSLEAQKQYQVLKNIHFLIVKIGFSISVAIATVIHFAGKEIVLLWTRGRIEYDYRLVNVLLLYIILQIIWQLSGSFQGAFNRPIIPGISYTCSAVMGLFLAYLLTPRYGTAGTVLGLLIAEFLFTGLILPFQTCRILGNSPLVFIREIIIRGIPLVASLYFFGLVVFRLLSYNIQLITIIGFGIIIVSFGMLCTYFVYFNRFERKIMVSMLLKRIKSS